MQIADALIPDMTPDEIKDIVGEEGTAWDFISFGLRSKVASVLDGLTGNIFAMSTANRVATATNGKYSIGDMFSQLFSAEGMSAAGHTIG